MDIEQNTVQHNSSAQHVANVVDVHRKINQNVFHKGLLFIGCRLTFEILPFLQTQLDHEHLHHYILLSLIIIVITSQFALWWWKQVHPKSFKRVTLFGVWLIPALLSFVAGFWRMIILWSIYTICCIKIFLELKV
jgi:small-conductance mechanosensitive channel